MRSVGSALLIKQQRWHYYKCQQCRFLSNKFHFSLTALDRKRFDDTEKLKTKNFFSFHANCDRSGNEGPPFDSLPCQSKSQMSNRCLSLQRFLFAYFSVAPYIPIKLKNAIYFIAHMQFMLIDFLTLLCS